ncbi:MAG: hypothetical protein M0013_10830 [Actinomycetota bacterium]|nr:hypothetical protein [Actinomycetota bacterium]
MDRISRVTAHAVAVEERIGRQSPLVGLEIRDAGLPAGCVVVTVQRRDGLVAATASTVLEHGDVVSVLTSPNAVDRLRTLVRGVEGPSSEARDAGPLP